MLQNCHGHHLKTKVFLFIIKKTDNFAKILRLKIINLSLACLMVTLLPKGLCSDQNVISSARGEFLCGPYKAYEINVDQRKKSRLSYSRSTIDWFGLVYRKGPSVKNRITLYGVMRMFGEEGIGGFLDILLFILMW